MNRQIHGPEWKGQKYTHTKNGYSEYKDGSLNQREKDELMNAV